MNNTKRNSRARRDDGRNSFEEKAVQMMAAHSAAVKEAQAAKYNALHEQFGWVELRSVSDQPSINPLVFGVDRNALEYCKP